MHNKCHCSFFLCRYILQVCWVPGKSACSSVFYNRVVLFGCFDTFQLIFDSRLSAVTSGGLRNCVRALPCW